MAGHVVAEEPVIGGIGFYLTSSDRNGDYVRRYNEELARLLAHHGPPSWRPADRVPTLSRIRQLYESSLPLGEMGYESKRERWLVRTAARTMAALDQIDRAVTCARDLEHGIVAVFGPPSPTGRAVTIIDTKYDTRMKSLMLVDE